MLAENLKKLGVDHILVRPRFFEGLKQYPNELVRIKDSELQKIALLFTKHMILRFKTLDEQMFWYSFNQAEPREPVVLNEDDARRFPVMYLKHATSIRNGGDLKTAKEMFERAIHIPMLQGNKAYVFAQLAGIHGQTGEPDKVKDDLQHAIDASPGHPRGYLDLALYHESLGEQVRANDLVKKSVSRGGAVILDNNPRFAVLRKYFP